MAGPHAFSRWVAASCMALPVGAIAWFELVYLFFGVTGQEPATAYKLVAAAAVLAAALVWPVHGTVRPAQVVRRSCWLGVCATVLLPVIAVAVLLLWQGAGGRRDLGMGGLMLYSMPVVAFAVSIVLALFFWACDRLAARQLRRQPTP